MLEPHIGNLPPCFAEVVEILLTDKLQDQFMVIACADSRVCPSYILGFQPGEAFVVRNVANLVPPFENGPSETNAALEFSVNSLEVENILVIGHSCCGGIRALMSVQDKESINRSLVNLLTYPWIEERVTKGVLSIHGGYYDFVDCTLEKWTLDYQEKGARHISNTFLPVIPVVPTFMTLNTTEPPQSTAIDFPMMALLSGMPTAIPWPTKKCWEHLHLVLQVSYF
ncbi:hypothetical protein TEA_001292 [Camellia sinensis var. sinensis]|uniref:Carbonic anhydrase n=1 Tax=Camellia sinensis var. sinensis TaxID=542762 RepID=A0A4S4DM02_CAMSN|nr:hypothetical protein TEA_001292 [Camellia sinensis var. sinensis]